MFRREYRVGRGRRCARCPLEAHPHRRGAPRAGSFSLRRRALRAESSEVEEGRPRHRRQSRTPSPSVTQSDGGAPSVMASRDGPMVGSARAGVPLRRTRNPSGLRLSEGRRTRRPHPLRFARRRRRLAVPLRARSHRRRSRRRRDADAQGAPGARSEPQRRSRTYLSSGAPSATPRVSPGACTTASRTSFSATWRSTAAT